MASSSSPETIDHVLQRARIRLALSRPFLASAVLRLPLVRVADSQWCRTAATDGYHVFYNPDWIAELDAASLRGLLAHEVLHVVFGHGDRRQGRDPERWNIACDHAINLLLLEQGFRLPADGLADREFSGLSAEQIYEKLQAPRARLGRRYYHTHDDAGAVPDIGNDLVDPNHPAVRPLRLPSAPDPERLREIRAELMADAAAKFHGDGAGQFQVEIGALGRARIDWRALLRAWLTDRVKSDWSTMPFNKKLLHRGLYFPSLGVEAPGEVVFAIDTSGSMDDITLAGLVDELRAFRETFPCRVVLLQADAAIQEVREFGEMDGLEVPPRLQIKGRGGTNFCPVFQWVAQQAPEAIVIYATDGFGQFPERAPPNAVLWLLTAGHLPKERVPFGAMVEVD